MAAEATRGAVDELSSQVQRHPRDLLRRLDSGHINEQPAAARGVELEKIELNLGLSLGGRFGMEPVREQKLYRSSSIASFSMFPVEDHSGVAPPLTRSSSLLTAVEEHRKRKVMQSLKRLEVKRRRLERKNSKSWAAKDDRNSEEDVGDGQGPVPRMISLRGGQLAGPVTGVARRAGAPQPMDTCRCFGPMSPGSGGSQGSSSSSSVISDLENRSAVRGLCVLDMNGSEEDQNQSATRPLAEPASTHNTAATPLAKMVGKVVSSSREKDDRSTAGRVQRVNRIGTRRESERNVMEEMPCVSTMGDGPNGRRIEGFLYKYKKGEEMRIVCVCHGRFLTPAEFVKHAGGADVPHPLRHIVVSTSPSAL